MARLYSNENFPLPAVDELRRLGHDVLTIQDAGHVGQAMADRDVLAFAHNQRRILVTMNRRHFIRLHREEHHSGIIVCSFDPDFVGLAQRIHETIKEQEDVAGQLIRVNRPNV